MRALLIALLLAGCMPSPGALLDAELLSRQTSGGHLSIYLANDVTQSGLQPAFGVPFENVPTNACRTTIFSPPTLSVPGHQGNRMTGVLQQGQCTILAAFWGNPRWQCYVTFNDTPGGIVSKMTQGQQTSCSYIKGTFHYAWI